MALAAELRLWVVLGSADPLTPPHWPHTPGATTPAGGWLVAVRRSRVR
jgi:hypothetical protein